MQVNVHVFICLYANEGTEGYLYVQGNIQITAGSKANTSLYSYFNFVWLRVRYISDISAIYIRLRVRYIALTISTLGHLFNLSLSFFWHNFSLNFSREERWAQRGRRKLGRKKWRMWRRKSRGRRTSGRSRWSQSPPPPRSTGHDNIHDELITWLCIYIMWFIHDQYWP